ncbi:hypothetical protein [Kutzneria kofuensis]|uniref:hypothetical protein n=1 Tax=Kutzneria kofuensis TaxID=103725 RepID=UPI0031E7FE5C
MTVYFNNHCSAQGVGRDRHEGPGRRLSVYCMVTNGGTSGKKKFDIGVDETVVRIQKGCSL